MDYHLTNRARLDLTGLSLRPIAQSFYDVLTWDVAVKYQGMVTVFTASYDSLTRREETSNLL